MGPKDRHREILHKAEQMSRVTESIKVSPSPAVVREVSRSGMELTMSVPVQAGMILRIEMPCVSAKVEVTSCRQKGANYRVSVLTLDMQSTMSAQQHVELDILAFYALGHGLVPSETMQVQAHLKKCSACQQTVRAMDQALHPSPPVYPNTLSISSSVETTPAS